MTSGSRRAKSTWNRTSAARADASSAADATTARPPDEQALAHPDEQRREHGLLAGEVPVDRGAADADRRAQVLDRDAVEAAAGEQLRGGREQRVAALGLGATAGGRRCASTCSAIAALLRGQRRDRRLASIQLAIVNSV